MSLVSELAPHAVINEPAKADSLPARRLVLGRAVGGLDLEELGLCPLLAESGCMWARGKRKVTEEHTQALKQSRYVIIDSRRMRGIPGEAIEREVRLLASKFKSLRGLLFVNRRGEVLRIK